MGIEEPMGPAVRQRPTLVERDDTRAETVLQLRAQRAECELIEMPSRECIIDEAGDRHHRLRHVSTSEHREPFVVRVMFEDEPRVVTIEELDDRGTETP